MSLFGTGRREGVIAVLLLAVIAALAVLAGAWLRFRGFATGIRSWPDVDQGGLFAAMQAAGDAVRRGDLPLWHDAPLGPGEALWHSGAPILYPLWWILAFTTSPCTQLLAALHCAIACATFYRFLRALGRSRYAAFLGGSGYGLSSFLLAAMASLPQAAAAAWLPLQLEAVLRTVTPGRYRQGTVLLCVALALPFLTGGIILATVGLLVSLLLLFGSQGRILSHERPHLRRQAFLALLLAALLTAPEWLAFAQLGALPAHSDNAGPPRLWTTAQPLAWLLHLGGLCLVLLPLALLRPQRQVRGWPWWLCAAGGGTLIALMASLLLRIDLPAPLPDALWNCGLWLFTTGALVLASAGLDDFLGAPQKRSPVLWLVPLLLVAVLVGLGAARAELLPLLWQRPGLVIALVGALLAAMLLPCWRPLGILRWKQAFATVLLIAAAAPALFDGWPLPTQAVPPAPLLEMAPPAALFLEPTPRLRFDCIDRLDPLRPSLRQVSGLPSGFRGRATSLASLKGGEETGTRRTFAVDMADGQGLVEFSDIAAPGWHVTLDGVPVAVLEGDYGTGAVAVPPGRHEVYCEFRPLLWSLGLPLAAIGMTGTLAWILIVLLRRRPTKTTGAATRKHHQPA